MRRTVEEEPAHAVVIDRQVLLRFKQFIEQRLQITLPDWWADGLLHAKANKRDNIYFDSPDWLMRAQLRPTVFGPHRISLEGRGDDKIVWFEDDPSTFPAKLVDPNNLQWSLGFSIGGCIVPERYYLVVYSQMPFGYRLSTIDRKSKKMRWQADVWADWGLTAYEGPGHYHWVTVLERDERVFVFGAGSVLAYIEAFDAKDGTNVFRFSTDY